VRYRLPPLVRRDGLLAVRAPLLAVRDAAGLAVRCVPLRGATEARFAVSFAVAVGRGVRLADAVAACERGAS